MVERELESRAAAHALIGVSNAEYTTSMRLAAMTARLAPGTVLLDTTSDDWIALQASGFEQVRRRDYWVSCVTFLWNLGW